jgi:hypothetical protein
MPATPPVASILTDCSIRHDDQFALIGALHQAINHRR